MNLPAPAYDCALTALEWRWLRRARRELLRYAGGTVLELGAGTGANIPYYRYGHIASLVLTDRVHRRGAWMRRVKKVPGGPPVRTCSADAQSLPFGDGTFDTVVATLLFCSVECSSCGFREIQRVLRPGGTYLFLEHVVPDSPAGQRIAERITPLWRRISGGCHLNRDTLGFLEGSGFSVELLGSSGGVFRWGRATRENRGGAPMSSAGVSKGVDISLPNLSNIEKAQEESKL